MKEYTPYQQRVRQCFAQAYRFIDTYKHPRTDEDWVTLCRALSQCSEAGDPLLSDLLSVCFDELEREYNAVKQGQGIP